MKMRFGLGVLAYIAPTFALGFIWHLVLFHGYYERLAIYRKDIIIPFGFLSMLIEAFIFAWGLPAGLRTAEREPPVARTYVRGIRCRTLGEFYDAGGRSQECDGIGPGLSVYRDSIHGCAVDNGRSADRACLCARGAESNCHRIASSRDPAPHCDAL